MLKLTRDAVSLNIICLVMASKPLIGITMRLDVATDRFYLGRQYSEAIEAFDGIPVHIPLIPDGKYIADLVSHLDGVLLPGSASDVDPDLFGHQPHPKLGPVVPERDKTDLLVLAEAEKRGRPVLGICFGMQSLNVFRGGTLIQDIGSEVHAAIKHEQGAPRDRNSHWLDVDGGRLGEIAGSEASRKVKVNSHHHQAIGELGRDLEVTARAADGVIECVEDMRNGRFVLGVQWHPELSWQNDDLSAAIFRTFVTECSGARSAAASKGN